MIRNTLVFALTTLLVLGCSRDNDQPAVETPPVDQAAQTSLFERIDADSIYVMANLEPLPDALINKFWAAFGPMFEANQQMYSEMVEEIDAPLAQALMREFLSLDGRDAFEARGLHGNGLWAFHGISLYPVVHWQLVDPAAFGNMLDRIAAQSGAELPWRGIDDERLIWVDMGDFGLAMHYDDQFVTAAVVPDDDTLLRRIANLDQPARSMNPRSLSDFNRERGYLRQGSGYVDFGLLVDRLLDADDDFIEAGRQTLNLHSIADDPACNRELRALAATFPRLSSGYTHVSNNEMTAAMRIETDRELGEKLVRITETPVGLNGERTGLFSFGVALNLVAARDFGRDIVGGWAENPPECKLFSNIRENAADWQLALNRPIPPVVTNIQGLRVNVERVETGGAMGVSDATGTLALFMRNPQMMIGMAQMFSPDLAALDLRPGGDPQPLPAGMIPNMPATEAWIAMGQNAIGLAVGEGQKDRLPRTLEPGQADSAILSYGVDWSAYSRMMQAMMANVREQYEAMGNETEMPSGEDMFAAFGEIYEYSDFSMHLTPEGIEFTSSVIMK